MSPPAQWLFETPGVNQTAVFNPEFEELEWFEAELDPIHVQRRRQGQTPTPNRPSWIDYVNSPYQSSRGGSPITAIIYHFTAGPKLEGTVQYFKNNNRNVSAHYVIGKDGRIVQMVPLNKASHHAGKSILAKKSGVNRFSVGIEIVNRGTLKKKGQSFRDRNNTLKRCIHPFCTRDGAKYTGQPPVSARRQYWEPFTDAQYDALIRLTRYLLSTAPTITHITGHEDVATPLGRKNDPGGAFDWNRIRTALRPTFRGHVGPLRSP